NLLPSDAGRPLSDITSRFVDAHLLDDVRHVLERLQVVERQLETQDGRWYHVRVLPYRTMDDRIDGVVITSQDLTERRAVEQQVQTSEERLRLLIDGAIDYAIFTMAEDGRIDSWNSGAERMFGYAKDEIVGQSVVTIFTPDDRAAGVPERELATAKAEG